MTRSRTASWLRPEPLQRRPLRPQTGTATVQDEMSPTGGKAKGRVVEHYAQGRSQPIKRGLAPPEDGAQHPDPTAQQNDGKHQEATLRWLARTRSCRVGPRVCDQDRGQRVTR